MQVEVKRALPRKEKQNLSSGDPSTNGTNGSHSFSGPESCKTKKIFVGGLPATLTNEEFAKYFQNYGGITDAVIIFDQCTGRPRGFGFITFDTEDAVDKVLEKNFHELNNKLVEVKRALRKESNPGNGAPGRKSYTYSCHGVNSPFGSQIESSIMSQLQPVVSYLPYSYYDALSFGYDFTNSAFYGTYGFGNHGNSYYIQGPGAWLYNVNAGYGAASPWSIGPLNHSKSGIHISRNQGYQHGNYHGSDVSYTDSAKGNKVSNSTDGTYMAKSSIISSATATEQHVASDALETPGESNVSS